MQGKGLVMKISDVCELDRVVSELMGPDCTDEIADAVSDNLHKRTNRPAYGTDWSEFLNPLDLWSVWQGVEERRAELIQACSYSTVDYIQNSRGKRFRPVKFPCN